MDGANVGEEFLEAWFSSPVFWKPEHVYLFLGKAHNSIKNDPDKKDKIKWGIKPFQKQLWNNGKDWKHVLGDHHFDLVTTFFQVKKNGTLARRSMNVDITSAGDLIGVIRNRHEHNKDYNEHEKRSLGWFREDTGDLHFDENLFIMYWISKFPTLGFVMWTLFSKEKGEGLPSYYQFTEKCKVAQFNCSQALHELEKGLVYQKYEGYLSSRWMLSTASRKMELQFRTAQENLIKQMLGTSSTLIALISGDEHHCTWKCNWYDKFGQMESTNNTEASTPSQSKTICIVVGNRVANVSSSLVQILYICSPENLNKLRRIFFILNREFEESTEEKQGIHDFVNNLATRENAQVKNMPFRWCKLPNYVQTSVETNLRFELQKRCISLNDIFSESEVEWRQKVLTTLDCEFLNQALRNKPLKIAKNFKLKNPSEFYREREITRRAVVNVADLQAAGELDFFVLSGIQQDNLLGIEELQNQEIKYINHVLDLETPFHKYMLHFPKLTKDFIERCENCITKRDLENIHFLHYLSDGVFEWIHTCGNTDFVINANNCSLERLSEAELISLQNEKLILVAGVPGLGKSEFVRSCGQKLVAMNNEIIVISTNLSTLIDAFDDRTIVSEESVVNALGKLAGDNEFENNLVCHFLKSQAKSYKVELILDSLDEVPSPDYSFAIQVLSIVKSSAYFSRIWLTTREHLLNDISSKFQLYGYKFLPFHKEHQINFLVMHWIKYFETQKHPDLPLNFLMYWRLAEFADNCWTSCTSTGDLACVPLHCKMIAEIYERHVYEGNFEVVNDYNNLISLYEGLMERKYQVYTEEKHNLNISTHTLANQILRDQFYSVHAYYAIKLLFGKPWDDVFQHRLLTGTLTLKQLENFALDFGVINSLHPLGFLHHTFAEYFLARHISQANCDKLLQVTGNSEEESLYFNFFSVCYMPGEDDDRSTFRTMINKFLRKFRQQQGARDTVVNEAGREKKYFVKILEFVYHYRNEHFTSQVGFNILDSFFSIVVEAEPFEIALNLVEQFAIYVKEQHPTVLAETDEQGQTLVLAGWPSKLPNIEKYMNVLKVLQRIGANFNAKDYKGNNILMLAVSENYPTNFIEFLVDCRVSTFCRNIYGETALHIAVKQGNFETIKLIGNVPAANVLVKDKYGKISADYASSIEIKTFLNLKVSIVTPFLRENESIL